MDPISIDIVARTWKRMASLSEHKAQKLAWQMQKEQPVVVAYLLAVDHDILTQDERELLFYIGTVVWQIMSRGSKPLPTITEEDIDDAEARNIKMTEYLQGETETGFVEATRTILNNYGQPEVLRYVVEALMEEPEKDVVIRDDSIGALFLDLKTVVDCFDV
ncbi:hypothetical protein M1O56_03740 [Dehalococcoidia bacterium]|nr:hypothetical protein [Dehalococcoidia bacterium]